MTLQCLFKCSLRVEIKKKDDSFTPLDICEEISPVNSAESIPMSAHGDLHTQKINNNAQKCRYNAVQYKKILHTVLPLPRQNIKQNLNS